MLCAVGVPPGTASSGSPRSWLAAVHRKSISVATIGQTLSPLTHVLLTAHMWAGPTDSCGHFCRQIPVPCTCSNPLAHARQESSDAEQR